MDQPLAHPLFARFFHRVCGRDRGRGERDLRRELLAGVSGRVVEVGPGNGINFVHYPRTVTELIAVEPELSNALAVSMAAGEPVTIEPRSIADGLNGPYAGANCVRVCRDLGVENLLVSEEELRDAFRFMYGRMKLACELAGAATAAALLAGKVPLERGNTVAAVVSGGNVVAQTAAAILAEQ